MAYTHVQTVGLNSVISASVATITPTSMQDQSAASGANPTTGSRALIVLPYFQAGNTPLTVVSVTNQSAVGITYAEPVLQSSLFNTDTGFILIDIPVMPAGVTSILVTLSGQPTFGGHGIFSEYTGLATGAADGVSSLAASVGTGTDAVVSGTATNAAQPAICWGAAIEIVGNTIPAAGTGFTSRLGANTARVEDKALSATGSQQATFTNTRGVSSMHIAAMVIIDEPGAGGSSEGSPMHIPRVQRFQI